MLRVSYRRGCVRVCFVVMSSPELDLLMRHNLMLARELYCLSGPQLLCITPEIMRHSREAEVHRDHSHVRANIPVPST